jgi:putative transposase
MPKGLHRYYGSGDLHFIPCSCYHREPRLGSARRRDLFLAVLEQVRLRYGVVVLGYVVMPEHQPSLWEDAPSAHIWQRRFYDFNVWSERKRIEKLRYLHRNPVKRGLVAEPDQWRWSSFRSYAYGEAGAVRINDCDVLKMTVRAA